MKGEMLQGINSEEEALSALNHAGWTVNDQCHIVENWSDDRPEMSEAAFERTYMAAEYLATNRPDKYEYFTDTTPEDIDVRHIVAKAKFDSFYNKAVCRMEEASDNIDLKNVTPYLLCGTEISDILLDARTYTTDIPRYQLGRDTIAGIKVVPVSSNDLYFDLVFKVKHDTFMGIGIITEETCDRMHLAKMRRDPLTW